MPDYGYVSVMSYVDRQKEKQLKKHRESCAKARAKRKKKNK